MRRAHSPRGVIRSHPRQGVVSAPVRSTWFVRCLAHSLRGHAFLKGILLKREVDGQDGVFEEAVSKGGVVRNATVSLLNGEWKARCRQRDLDLDKSPDSNGSLDPLPLDWEGLYLQEMVRAKSRNQVREGS